MKVLILTLGLFGMLLSGSAQAIVDFRDGGIHDITYAIDWQPVRVDWEAPGMQTTLNLLEGGRIGVFPDQGPALTAYNDSRVNIAGGSVGDPFYAVDNSQVTISSGSVGWLDACGDTRIKIDGGWVGGPSYAGDNSQVKMTGGSVYLLRAGGNSQVTMTGGSVLGEDFVAGGDSHINIGGGWIERSLIAVDNSQVTMISGSVNWLRNYGNNQVTMTGGSVRGYLEACGDSRINIDGGSVNWLQTYGNSQVTMTGGSVVYGLWAWDNSQVTMSSGSVGSFRAWDNSQVNWSGGTVGGDIWLNHQSVLTIEGSDFAIDGTPFGNGDITSLFHSDPSADPLRHLTGILANGDIIDNDFYIGHDAKIVLAFGPAGWFFDSDFQYNLDNNYATVEGTGRIRGTASLSDAGLSVQAELTFNGPSVAVIPELYLIATDGPDRELAQQLVDPQYFSYSQVGPNTYRFSGSVPDVIKPINDGHYEVSILIPYGAEKYQFFVNTDSLINKYYFPLIRCNVKLSIPVYAPISQKAHQGTALTYTARVTNEGNTEDTIMLSVSNQSVSNDQSKWWDVQFSSHSLTLLPGESNDICLTLTVEENSFNEITIKGESSNVGTRHSETTIKAGNIDWDATLFGVELYFSADPCEEHTLFFEVPACAKIATSFGRIVYIVFDPEQPGDLDNTYLNIKDKVNGNIVKDINLPIIFEQHCDEVIATGFDLTEDTYNFSNNHLDGYHCASYDEGYCYGMAETSILYYEDLLSTYNNKMVYDLTEPEAMEDIAIYQWRWRNREIWVASDDSEDYERLCQSISDNHPTLIMLSTNKWVAEHVVVAYKILKDYDKKSSYIFVYNPNNEYKLQALLQAFHVIIYDWDSSRFLPYESFVYMDVQEAKLLNYVGRGASWIWGRANECPLDPSRIIIVMCPVNIEITDQYNRIITDAGINEIPGAYCDITDKHMIFYLPPDLSYSTKVESYEKGTFGYETACPIETGSMGEITFDEDVAVDSNTTVRIAGLAMEIDYDGDGVFEKTITGSTDIIYKTKLAYKGDSACFCSQSVNFQALLSTETGNALTDRVVTFRLGSQSIATITDVNGIAAIELPLSQNPGRYTLEVEFSGGTGEGCYYIRCYDSAPFDIYMLGDINQDWAVDFYDLGELANEWLANCLDPNWCSGADLNKSGSVDLYDLAEFVEYWLEGF